MTRIIRYRTQLPQAAANEELVRAVFAELQRTQPGGLSYAVYRREDEFVHLVKHLAGPSPLLAVQAFGEFQAGLPGRCAQPPTRTEFQEIATYQNGL